MPRWKTIAYYIDVETSERIPGKRRVREEYTVIRTIKNTRYDSKKNEGYIEYTVECIRNKYRQGDLFK